MTTAKNRSRLLILNHITQFSLAQQIENQPYCGLAEMRFQNTVVGDNGAVPGDLVAIQSAPSSKWYLGWLISKQWPAGHACEQYTIESIEDGELCDWSNVRLIYYNRSQIRDHPEWRWTDEQHEFNGRWKAACYKDRDAHVYLPMQAEFCEEDSVTLRIRVRFEPDCMKPQQTFPDWKKVTKKAMLEFYDRAVEEIKSSYKPKEGVLK